MKKEKGCYEEKNRVAYGAVIAVLALALVITLPIGFASAKAAEMM